MKKLGEFTVDVPMQWYKDMIVCNIPYKRMVVDFVMENEIHLEIELDGKTHTGCVPKANVDSERGVVTATLLGQEGEMVLVSFPPTNYGTFRFKASVDSLENLERGVVEKTVRPL